MKIPFTIACWQHTKVGYKKGCKDCFEANVYRPTMDDDWHLCWERDNFGDN